MPVVVPPFTDPAKLVVLLLEQIVWLPPALTTDAWRTVTTTVCETALQGARLPVEVNVSVTVPAVASPVEGA